MDRDGRGLPRYMKHNVDSYVSNYHSVDQAHTRQSEEMIVGSHQQNTAVQHTEKTKMRSSAVSADPAGTVYCRSLSAAAAAVADWTASDAVDLFSAAVSRATGAGSAADWFASPSKVSSAGLRWTVVAEWLRSRGRSPRMTGAARRGRQQSERGLRTARRPLALADVRTARWTDALCRGMPAVVAETFPSPRRR